MFPSRLLARLAFPDYPRAVQRRFFRQLCLAVFLGLIVASATGAFIYLQSGMANFR